MRCVPIWFRGPRIGLGPVFGYVSMAMRNNGVCYRLGPSLGRESGWSTSTGPQQNPSLTRCGAVAVAVRRLEARAGSQRHASNSACNQRSEPQDDQRCERSLKTGPVPVQRLVQRLSTVMNTTRSNGNSKRRPANSRRRISGTPRSFQSFSKTSGGPRCTVLLGVI